MKLFAARYWADDSEMGAYEIVLYESAEMSEEQPHDYLFSFTRQQWRKMGCRVPKRDETMPVTLRAEVL